MGIYDRFKTSSDSETNGVSFVIETARVTMRRAGGDNKGYVKALADYASKNQKALAIDAIPIDEQGRKLRALFADFIIIDWETNVSPDDKEPTWKRGIEGPGADLLEFNRENVLATLEALPDLWAMLKGLAEDQKNYREALVKQIAGN